MSRKRREMASKSRHTVDEREFYPEDSVDRFGDDLCQHLLSFLSLEDRFRCECVSKQWQRVIYETQTSLECWKCANKSIKPKTFELIVKKCPNIRSVCLTDVRFSNIVFESITQHCDHLNAIYFNHYINSINTETVDTFFAKFAKQLRVFQWDVNSDDNSEEYMKIHLKFCYNLTKLLNTIDNRFIYLPYVLSGDTNEPLFQKLQNFRFIYRSQDASSVEVFVRKYANTMKSIVLEVDRGCDDKCIDVLMTGLSQMQALIDLQIFWYYDTLSDDTVLTKGLQRIGTKCLKLKSLGLIVEIESLPEVIQTVNKYFTQLKRLKLNADFSQDFVFTAESLNQLKGLTHLSVDPMSGKPGLFGEDFAQNMDKLFPRLQDISLTDIHITDSVLNSLSRIQTLQCIRLHGTQDYEQATVDNMWKTCRKIKTIML